MRCRAFTFLLNLVWFLFIYEKFIVKNPLQFYREKICPIHYLYFSFEVENLETISSTFLLKFPSEIFLSRIINNWGSIFTSYLTWGALSLVCVLSVFFSFFFVFFLFLFVFSWTDTSDSQDIRERRENHFLFFHFQPLTNIHLVHRDFYLFFLINLFVITKMIANETSSP